jgi:hypothetical protein
MATLLEKVDVFASLHPPAHGRISRLTEGAPDLWIKAGDLSLPSLFWY